MLRNWRVRSRLVLLITIPTATAVALGGASIISSWQSAVDDQRTEVLASMSTKITQLAFQLEAELDAIVWYIAAGRVSGKPVPGSTSYDQLVLAKQEIGYTKPSVLAVDAGVAGIASGYPQIVRQDASAVRSTLSSLPGLRHRALYSKLAAEDVINSYQSIISVLLAFDDQVALSSSDPQLTSTARALGTISRYEYEDSTQRAIVMYGLTAGNLNSGLDNALTTSIANQQADFAEMKG